MRRWNTRKNCVTLIITKNKLLLAFFISFALLVSLVSGTLLAEPKKVPTAKPGDCATCHESKKVLPQSHGDTKDMNYGGCTPCHPKTGNGTFRTKMPGSHTHNLAGVTCEKCHGKAEKQEAPEMKQCLACHNPEKLVEKTAKIKPENPHTSPHYGSSLDCNLCHLQHGKSENYCNQCHQFNFVVP